MKAPPYVTEGQLITAAMWNELCHVAAAGAKAAEQVEADPLPSLAAAAAVAMVASGATKRISRRALLFPWRRA